MDYIRRKMRWMSFPDGLEELSDTLVEGDLVEFCRQVFSHWGVAVGRGDDGQQSPVHLEQTASTDSVASLSPLCIRQG